MTMAPTTNANRFACLKLEGDSSEDEFTSVPLTNKKGQNHNGKKSAQKGKAGPAKPPVNARPLLRENSRQLDDGLIVHTVEQKKKSKSKKPVQVLDEKTGLYVQTDENTIAEMRYKNDLKEALRESRELTNLATASANLTPAEVAMESINASIRKTNGTVSNPSDNTLVQVYKEKLSETLKDLYASRDENMRLKDDVEKYKSRYKKIVELLRDAEVNEKARLVMEAERARSVEAELLPQVEQLQAEVARLRTRLGHK